MQLRYEDSYTKRMNAQLGIIKDLGYTLQADAAVLDLGCGRGNLLQEYRKNGYDAYGCDFTFRPDVIAELKEKEIIKLIRTDVYQLPFDDNTFDFVYSDQVFEHVADYSTTLAEIRRVLKPGGISLHFFPSRYKAIEVHVKVPFGSIIRTRPWLRLWASLGVKNQFQNGLAPKVIADLNYDFLRTRTNYLRKSELQKFCRKYFEHIAFCEKQFLKYSQRAPFLHKIARLLPFIPVLYSSLHSRVLFLHKKAA